MSIIEIIIAVILAVIGVGGAVFAYSKKTSQKNITIIGGGKVVGGDDNSREEITKK